MRVISSVTYYFVGAGAEIRMRLRGSGAKRKNFGFTTYVAFMNLLL
jgi:hypothetical protein